MPSHRNRPALPARKSVQPANRRGLWAGVLAVAGLLLLTGGYLWLLGGTTPRTVAVGGPFQLTAASGETVTERSYAGRYMLVYFGYSACRDVCPATLGAVGDAMDALGAQAGRVQPLFITVDPHRDTPAVLGRYVANFSPRLIGLTGTPRQLRQVQQEFRITSIAHTDHLGATDYTVDHSSVLYLLGPDGRYLAPIPADDTGAAMAAAIIRHMS
jgi:protein SCO1/2